MRSLINIVSAIFFMLIVPSGMVAQSYVGGSGMVNAGYMWTPALSSSLQSRSGGSVNFPNGFPVIGTELNYRNGKSVIVLAGYIGMQEATVSQTQLIEPFIWKTHGGYGRMIYSTRSLFVYPVIGIGALGSSLIYHNTADSDTHATSRSVAVDLSVHTDYFLSIKAKPKGFAGVTMVSFRLGYTKGFSVHELQGLSLTLSFAGLAFMK